VALVRELGALAERLQVELGRDGNARDRELAVDRDDERLEEPRARSTAVSAGVDTIAGYRTAR